MALALSLGLGSRDSNYIDYENDESDLDSRLNTKFDLSDRVASDMLKMFCEGTFNDICIKLHDGEIKANKFVLAARSEYFAATFRWKENNNNQDMQDIVINDCSKKIMTRIIEYIFSGILKAKNLNLLEFLELRDQVRKMFPGDKLEVKIEDLLKEIATEGGVYLDDYEEDSPHWGYPSLAVPPTEEEIVKALSLVETGNLQPEVLVELAGAIESHIMIWGEVKFKENYMALANLISYGVIESVQNLKLTVSPCDHLQALLPCVRGTIHISNLWPDFKNDAKKCNLAPFLDAITCKELHLEIEKMNQEETEALVRAMTTRVEILHLETFFWFQIDFDTFSKYEGDGKCREVHISWHSESSHLLSSLLDSVNCKELHLFVKSHCLRKEETEALVRAMTTRVEIVHLGGKDGVYKDTISLDFDMLTEYKGDGKCREVHCNYVCVGWREDAEDMFGYDVDYDYNYGIMIPTDEGNVQGVKDEWMDDGSAETWADQMNWDLKVENPDGEYVFTRK